MQNNKEQQKIQKREKEVNLWIMPHTFFFVFFKIFYQHNYPL